MATVKKSGGWDSSYGGRDFSGKGGKVNFLGKENGNGVPKASKPSVDEAKKGQVNFLGAGGNRGIPPKGGGSSKGLSSKDAAALD
jgi:hypothetical protein